MIFVFIFVALILFVLFHQFYWRLRHLPKGPTPLPFFGNLLSFKDGQLETVLKQWRKDYGDLHTIWLGTMPVVTLHDSPTIYQTFLKDGSAYEDRAPMVGIDFVRGGTHGIGGVNGDLWRERRRFALKVLRDFGLGRNMMQERVLTEISAVILEIQKDIKRGINVQPFSEAIDKSIGSVINSLLFGYRFDESTIDEFRTIKGILFRFFQKTNTPAFRVLESNMNFLRHFPVLKTEYDSLVQVSIETEQFFMDKIDKHKAEVDFESDPRDYCEAFLQQRHQLEKSGVLDHTFTDKQLFSTCFDLWVAGQDTTATTLSWLFIYVLNHPHVQDKVHKELKRVIGSDRFVTIDDKNDLPYLNAVVAESQRLCSLLPINILHKTTRQVEIHDQIIPKNTVITNQISSLLCDEKVFKNPDKFDPDRFLDQNGKFSNPVELMPFGIGKRACLGEGLARMELYLFTANIFNQFKLQPENGQFPSMERIVGGAASPHPFNCVFENIDHSGK